ncbi:hypothetical protein P8452_60796 [Trifolium repens]|nr:hypothetical protein P8452_60796 [Trifolium repens]
MVQMLPGGQLIHSGVRRIEYLEDPNHDGWEIDRDNNRLVFSGLTSSTTEYGVMIIRERLEQILPMNRLRLSLLGDVNNAPPEQMGADPIVNMNVPHQELLIPQHEVQFNQAEMVADNEVEINFSFEEEEDPEEDPNSLLEEGEFRPNGH